MFQRDCAISLLISVAFFAAFGGDLARVQADFTEKEQQNLDAGKLVTRYEHKAVGNLKLVGGTSWQVVDASPEVVWKGFREFHRWKHFLPQCDASKILKRSGKGVILRIEHSEGPISATYHMLIKPSETIRAAHFKLSSRYSNDIREGWGFVRITPYKGDKALISYGVMADVGTGILAGTARSSIHKWMLHVPRLFRQDLRRRLRR